jgi:hypothetical protein
VVGHLLARQRLRQHRRLSEHTESDVRLSTHHTRRVADF